MNRVADTDVFYQMLKKGRETYVFSYDENSKAEMFKTLGRFASTPDLSFTWYDAAVVSQRVRAQT